MALRSFAGHRNRTVFHPTSDGRAGKDLNGRRME